MAGRITTIHLLTHWYDIVHEWGWGVYWNAWRYFFGGY